MMARFAPERTAGMQVPAVHFYVRRERVAVWRDDQDELDLG
jgi:hypothetical protein